MKKIKFILTLVLISFLLASLNVNGQKSLSSSKNTVTIANGNPTSVTNEKKVYIYIALFDSRISSRNDIGRIDLLDQPWGSKVTRYYQENFKVYSAKLNDDGTYNYWTIDIGNDGQTVLFKVDNNSAVSTITVSRYSPVGNSTVLKKTIYYID